MSKQTNALIEVDSPISGEDEVHVAVRTVTDDDGRIELIIRDEMPGGWEMANLFVDPDVIDNASAVAERTTES